MERPPPPLKEVLATLRNQPSLTAVKVSLEDLFRIGVVIYELRYPVDVATNVLDVVLPLIVSGITKDRREPEKLDGTALIKSIGVLTHAWLGFVTFDADKLKGITFPVLDQIEYLTGLVTLFEGLCEVSPGNFPLTSWLRGQFLQNISGVVSAVQSGDKTNVKRAQSILLACESFFVNPDRMSRPTGLSQLSVEEASMMLIEHGQTSDFFMASLCNFLLRNPLPKDANPKFLRRLADGIGHNNYSALMSTFALASNMVLANRDTNGNVPSEWFNIVRVVVEFISDRRHPLRYEVELQKLGMVFLMNFTFQSLNAQQYLFKEHREQLLATLDDRITGKVVTPSLLSLFRNLLGSREWQDEVFKIEESLLFVLDGIKLNSEKAELCLGIIWGLTTRRNLRKSRRLERVLESIFDALQLHANNPSCLRTGLDAVVMIIQVQSESKKLIRQKYRTNLQHFAKLSGTSGFSVCATLASLALKLLDNDA